jgi:CheY-like chemotaxis protein
MNYVLVVDDSPLDRKLIGHVVQKQTGYQVQYATNGLEAIEILEARLPLAVLTDLQMPEMDGLALVQAIRKRFPAVPVILMTQHGSEDIAFRALEYGATDYVPKLMLTKKLREAISGVVAIAGAMPTYRLLPYLEQVDLRYVLDSDPDLVLPLANQLRQSAADVGLVDEAEGIRLARALAEAVRNAMLHGNLELPSDVLQGAELSAAVAARRQQSPFAQRRVHLASVCRRDHAQFTIRDEGPGFDAAQTLAQESGSAQILEGPGRGLVLMRAFTDEMRYNAAGNEVTLVKVRRETPPV